MNIPVTAAHDGQRLDRLIKAIRKDIPFPAVQKLIRTGKIRVDGQKAKPDARVKIGQIVTLVDANPIPHTSNPATPRQYPLTRADRAMLAEAVLYEDDALLVINKPAGLATQAGSGITRSLDRLMVGVYGPEKAPKLTHRLDKDTSGVIVLAKTREVAATLTRGFAERDVGKLYLALVEGHLNQPNGHIRAPLAKAQHAHGSRAVVRADGDHAHTEWRVVSPLGPHTLIEAIPHTGRMNQIRAHLAHIGHPLVGDSKYGATGLERNLHLHAYRLTFTHPMTGKQLDFVAPAPAWAQP